MLLLFSIIVFLLIVGTGFVAYKTLSTKPKNPELKNYSWASKQLIAEYKLLPDEHKPMDNIEDMVAALDIKYGVDKVNAHFLNYFSDSPSWRCYNLSGYHYTECNRFSEYHDLHDNIVGIETAIRQRTHALQVAGVAHSISAIEELNEHLRAEQQLVKDVTKELIS